MPDLDTAVCCDDQTCLVGSCETYEQVCAALDALAHKGGPEEEDYPCMDCLMTAISRMRRSGEIDDHRLCNLWDRLGRAGTPETIIGLMYRIPYGYHGDFDIVDRLYTGHVNPDPALARWDTWPQSLAAAEALRNRRQFFVQLISEHGDGGQPLTVLNVGSGPCRDVADALRTVQRPQFYTCVDLDPHAIAYARRVVRASEHGGHVEFRKQNILRIKERDRYDVAWSAGVFDYLDDRAFVKALQRLHRATRPGGRVVVGNFSPRNPTINTMEFADWHLHYRTEAELLALAQRAAIPADACEVTAEPLHVNLFLTVRRT